MCVWHDVTELLHSIIPAWMCVYVCLTLQQVTFAVQVAC